MHTLAARSIAGGASRQERGRHRLVLSSATTTDLRVRRPRVRVGVRAAAAPAGLRRSHLSRLSSIPLALLSLSLWLSLLVYLETRLLDSLHVRSIYPLIIALSSTVQ